MKILVYKRTHCGDPGDDRRFGQRGCMGRVRGFDFDTVIGIGGVGWWPRQEGIAERLTWVGRNPRTVSHDARGPILSFTPKDFLRLDEVGPLFASVAPKLAKRFYSSGARFMLDSFSPAERHELESLVMQALDTETYRGLKPVPRREQRFRRCKRSRREGLRELKPWERITASASGCLPSC
jgi:hypothetical protein